jgi:predicted nucleotidyltransferase
MDRRMPQQLAARIAARLAEVEGVVAVALGGSCARPDADAHADVDLGIYYHPERPLAVEALRVLAAELDERGTPDAVTDVGAWGPWINGGAWLRVGGHRVDWLYRDLARVATTIEDCRAGRTTCDHQLGHPDGFHNHIYAAEVHHAVPLFDPFGALATLQRRVATYPPALKRALVAKHVFEAEFWLAGCDRSARRGDGFHVVGSLFRSAASCVQVVFALNERWWINEKHALAAAGTLAIAPPRFAEVVARVLAHPGESPAELAASVESLGTIAHALRALGEPILTA